MKLRDLCKEVLTAIVADETIILHNNPCHFTSRGLVHSTKITFSSGKSVLVPGDQARKLRAILEDAAQKFDFSEVRLPNGDTEYLSLYAQEREIEEFCKEEDDWD